jgi:hypothetical protein
MRFRGLRRGGRAVYPAYWRKQDRGDGHAYYS